MAKIKLRLSPAHRDSCLRALHLSKSDKDRLTTIYEDSIKDEEAPHSTRLLAALVALAIEKALDSDGEVLSSLVTDILRVRTFVSTPKEPVPPVLEILDATNDLFTKAGDEWSEVCTVIGHVRSATKDLCLAWLDFVNLWNRLASHAAFADRLRQLAGTEPDAMINLQKVAWKLACYRASNMTEDKRPTKEQRLLASCGALSFLAALASALSADGGDEPEAKRPKLDDTTPWAILKEEPNLEIDEEAVKKELVELSTELWNVTDRFLDEDESSSRQPSAQWVQDWLAPLPSHISSNAVATYLKATSALFFHSYLEANRYQSYENRAFMDESALAMYDSLAAIGSNAEFGIEASKDAEEEKDEDAPAVRVVTPPILTERMEVNEWTVSLLYLETVKPSEKLYKLLSGDGSADEWKLVVIPVLGRCLLRLSQEQLGDKPSRVMPVAIDDATGAVTIPGETITPDKQLCKAVAAAYYHALEAILYCERLRLGSGDAAKATLKRTLLQSNFHKAVLASCMVCVLKAIGFTQKLLPISGYQSLSSIQTILFIAECSSYDYCKVSETFYRSLTTDMARNKLGSPLIFELPRSLVRELKMAETHLVDTVLWAIKEAKFTDSSLPEKIGDFQEKTTEALCYWPPEVLVKALRDESPAQAFSFPTPKDGDYVEYRCISYLMRKILNLAESRLANLCEYLSVPPHTPLCDEALDSFCYLLCYHVDLLYDRHIDQWILCCLYGVGKTIKYQPEITFARIIDAYVVVRGQELSDIACQRVVRQIKMDDTDDSDDAPIGDIITLYNRVFVPKMKDHLLKSTSLKFAAEELAQIQSSVDEVGGADKRLAQKSHLKVVLDRLLSQKKRFPTQTIIELGLPHASAFQQANIAASG